VGNGAPIPKVEEYCRFPRDVALVALVALGFEVAAGARASN
jgi:hypothetical protein